MSAAHPMRGPVESEQRWKHTYRIFPEAHLRVRSEFQNIAKTLFESHLGVNRILGITEEELFKSIRFRFEQEKYGTD